MQDILLVSVGKSLGDFSTEPENDFEPFHEMDALPRSGIERNILSGFFGFSIDNRKQNRAISCFNGNRFDLLNNVVERAASDKHDALILIAGPGAGLLQGVLVLVGQFFIDPVWLAQQRLLGLFITYLLYVNLVWSFVNLVPLWPLDGGQLFRLGLLRLTGASQAERATHIVGTVLGVIACFIAFSVMGSRFMAIIAGFLTWQNIQRLNSSSASGPIRSQNRHAKEVLKQAKAAYEQRDWSAAERLAHQAKAESVVDPSTVALIFEILGVAKAALGKYEDAWRFLQRAPMRGQVYLAKVECVLALGLAEDAPGLLQDKRASELPSDVVRDLERLAHGMSPSG